MGNRSAFFYVRMSTTKRINTNGFSISLECSQKTICIIQYEFAIKLVRQQLKYSK